MNSPRPNILLLLTDQQRFDTIRAAGSSFGAHTPHLDALAGAGVVFEKAFCTAPICSPSRATLMTGLHPSQAGVPGNLGGDVPPLSPALPTVGKRMRAAGYETAYHGKWHLGGSLHDHGFDVAEECSHDESTRLLASRFWKNRDWMTSDRPFFHVVSFLNPHDHYFFDPDARVAGFRRPWGNTAPPVLPAVENARRADWPEEKWGAYFAFYERLLERVDADIGETLHQLRCSGFFSNTWILFASDHGDMAGEHNLPFKGPFGYDGVTRVPLIIVPPQARFAGPQPTGTFETGIRPGRRGQLCSLLDIVPTILDLGGVPTHVTLAGRSLLPILRDETAADPHEYIFAAWHQPGMRMARSQEWKYFCHEDGAEALFHLAEDPHETRNLAPTFPSHPAKSALARHLAETDDPRRDTFPTLRLLP